MKIVVLLLVGLVVFSLFSAVALAQSQQDQYTSQQVQPPTAYDPGAAGRASLPSTGMPFSLLIIGAGLIGLGAASEGLLELKHSR